MSNEAEEARGTILDLLAGIGAKNDEQRKYIAATRKKLTAAGYDVEGMCQLSHFTKFVEDKHRLCEFINDCAHVAQAHDVLGAARCAAQVTSLLVDCYSAIQAAEEKAGVSLIPTSDKGVGLMRVLIENRSKAEGILAALLAKHQFADEVRRS